MKLILTTILFWAYAANATNYYISNSGNDSNDGLTTATAWQTLSKVNASTFNAGDSILLKRGDSWNERLILKSSGSAGNPIIVGAYGSGNKPLITGLQTVTLTNVGNIWSGIASNSVKSLNTVLVDGKIRAKGRYPNADATNGGYLTYQSATQTSLTSSSLTGTPNYTGKECVVRTAAWILDVVKVASQSTSTLNFSQSLTYNAGTLGGTGFFFQNDSTFLDAYGEWSYDSTSKKLCVYSASTPIVQISTIDTLVYVNGHSYITFDNLSIQGANVAAFQFDSLSNIIVQNCSINYSGSLALSAQKCSYLSAINDSIQNSLSGSIYWRRVDPYTPMQDTCNFATVSGNYIKNTGIYAGMGMNNNGRYVGIYVVGRKPLILNNRIDSIGFNAVFFNGDTGLIKNNYISNFCFVKNDGGGIVTVIGSYVPSTYNNGTVVRSNIIVNGIGQSYGNVWVNTSSGIYLDQSTNNLTIDSNTIYNCDANAMSIGMADINVITNNNIYNGIGNGMTINGDNSYISATGNQINGNAIYSSSSSWPVMYRYGGTNMGVINNNYYSGVSENTNFNYSGTLGSLYKWQSLTGIDINSKVTPLLLLSNVASLVYNPTFNDSTITFSGRKISLRGVTYAGSITLHPFQSAILFDAIVPHSYKFQALK
jgi:hypothetical protein